MSKENIAGIDLDIAAMDNLEALARTATLGPWQVDRTSVRAAGEFDRICTMQVSNQPNWETDAKYIAAANPATLLTLIAIARRFQQSISFDKTYHGKCQMCNGSGIVSFPPDQYEDCPDCSAARLGTSEQQARYAIDGAIQYGRENRNPPPSTDHWLYEYWNIGQQLRELGKTGWDNVTSLSATAAGAGTVGNSHTPPSAKPHKPDLRGIGEDIVRAAGAGSAQPRAEGVWNWKQRAEAAEVFLRNYADTNMEILLDGYHVQPIIRRLAAAILEWQTAALDQGAQAATTASASDIKTWQERSGMREFIMPKDAVPHMAAEIRELRAALARAPLPAQSSQPELTVWYGPMPESNGKSNFTAVLHRKDAEGFDRFTDGFQFARGEYPDRVRYEADFMLWLLGERDTKPEVWDDGYDMDKYSGYVKSDAAMRANDSAAGQEGAAC